MSWSILFDGSGCATSRVRHPITLESCASVFDSYSSPIIHIFDRFSHKHVLQGYLSNRSIPSKFLMLIFHLYKCAQYAPKYNRARFWVCLLASVIFWLFPVPISDSPSFSAVHVVMRFSTQSACQFRSIGFTHGVGSRDKMRSLSSRDWEDFDYLESGPKSEFVWSCNCLMAL
jgi:hypothetical protein